MPNVTIDNIDYDLDSLSDAAKAQLASLQAVDRRLSQLQEEVAIHQTARIAYANALKAELAAKDQTSAAKLSWPKPE
jgi:hypothetical protein